MRLARGAVVFTLGCFALVSQTLLFRDFLATFEGNELGVGCFFGTWLLWVATGAAAGRVKSLWHQHFTTSMPLFALLFPAAFLLQRHLLDSARFLAGVQAYEAFPFLKMTVASLLLNAPVGFVTGLLFTIACAWAAGEYPGADYRAPALPVALVYVLEALGSSAGGIITTLLLSMGLAGESVFIMATILLVCAAAAASKTRASLALASLCVLLVVFLISGGGLFWAERHRQAQWERLVSGEYEGSFTTSQGAYLHGESDGQLAVIAWGGVCETPFDQQAGGESVAVNLAQFPGATKVLVAGPGAFPICASLLKLPSIEHVAWLHPDPEYPGRLAETLTRHGWTKPGAMEIPGEDIRDYARETTRRYDLIILNLPDATTLVLNRYSTVEFFRLVKGILGEDGVLSVRVTGAANYMGDELAYLGSSMLTTLESAFSHVVLKPGDDSWLIASDGDGLSESAAVLRDRFASVEGAAEIYPPDALLSLYPADRIAFQMDNYRRASARASPGMLVNTDREPKALLYSLLVALRRAGIRGLPEAAEVLLNGGFLMCLAAIAVHGVFRVVYLLKTPAVAPGRSFVDTYFLIASTGLAGMSLSVVLMFLYQARFGSLFLHIGVVTSLFMLGSFAGGFVSRSLLSRRAHEPRWLLAAYILPQLCLVLAISTLPATAGRPVFALLFLTCGVSTSVYFPLAAHRMAAGQRGAAKAASSLEMSDYIGGALGAVSVGVMMLPLFGATRTLWVLAALLGVNLAPWLLSRRAERLPQATDAFERRVRPVGYVLCGTALCALVFSRIIAGVYSGDEAKMLREAIAAMTGGAEGAVEVDKPLSDGTNITYHELPAATSETPQVCYAFSTRQLAPDILGYGGRIVMAVFMGERGELKSVEVLESNETPAYLALLDDWIAGLAGRNLFADDPFAGVDAVSGATMTANAVMETLAVSGRRFSSEVLGRESARTTTKPQGKAPELGFWLFPAMFAGALAIRRWPRPWLRRTFLVSSFVIFGFWLNMQYSMLQVASLLRFDIPSIEPTASFIMLVALPVLVALFGNLYCGYMCPFGAVQEIIELMPPRCPAIVPDRRVWRHARLFKYLLLFLIVMAFAVTRDLSVLSADPLITIFSSARDRTVVVMALGVLLACVFFRRFWCRNLCPAGAFLALLNGMRLTRLFRPATRPSHCDLGVEKGGEMDCICCDRCRYDQK